jgi:large subunit ribosomal protein L14e
MGEKKAKVAVAPKKEAKKATTPVKKKSGKRAIVKKQPYRLFRRFVEIGRVAYITYGKDQGKICVIVDVIDQSRALVDGPPNLTGVNRRELYFKRMALTDLKVRLPCPSAKRRYVIEAMEKGKILQKWKQTNFYKKLEKRQLRRQMTDFDRFKVMKFRQERNRRLVGEFSRLQSLHNRKVNERSRGRHLGLKNTDWAKKAIAANAEKNAKRKKSKQLAQQKKKDRASGKKPETAKAAGEKPAETVEKKAGKKAGGKKAAAEKSAGKKAAGKKASGKKAAKDAMDTTPTPAAP